MMICMYILMSFLFISCEFESSKKVYKSFDTIEGELIEQQQYDVSRWTGGPGFEEIYELLSWKTNEVKSMGDKNSIKGDTLVFKAGDIFLVHINVNEIMKFKAIKFMVRKNN